ncbi:MAG TPA: Fe-S cluster assembly protein SufD [Terriglobia bacterium]|nr:Fe-S cluster assembly protein SufD [Terriglobia bacterium]
MIAVTGKHDFYFSSFLELEKSLAGRGHDWIEQVRREAIERFAELGFPTTKHEEWRFTNIGALAATPFEPAAPVESATVGSQLAQSPFADLGCPRLVFLNGRYAPELSDALPGGVKAGSLRAALAAGSPVLERQLTRYAHFQKHPFVALNTAFMEDGALVEIAKDVVLEKPIYLLYVSVPDDKPAVTHPRNLILAGRGAQATVIEGYLSLETGNRISSFQFPFSSSVYFTNAVTEFVADEGAIVNHYKVEQESESAFHVATLVFHQGRSSTVNTCTIQFGGKLVREEVRNVLDGEGAESTFNGLYVISGEQHVDNHTTLDHARPHCASREFYKGVLDGHAHAVFNGRIIVRQDAQKTDSKQSNKNLLLSADAVIDSKPQLEIYADDVKCTHGATIGQVDQEAVFYLRSRGIGLDDARSLLVQAFASDIIGRVKYEPLAARLRDRLSTKLAK